MRRSSAALVACAVLGLLAAGCGDDDEERAEPEPAGTAAQTAPREETEPAGARAEYIGTADAYCARTNRELAPLQVRAREAAAGATSREEAIRAAAPVLEEAHRARAEAIEGFRRIEPPAENRRTIRTLLDVYEEQNAVFKRYGEAARRGDFEAYSARERELAPLTARARDLTSEFGFQHCGRGLE